jgi:hypothetical protein
MEVSVVIPEDLIKYLEYIPADMLPSVVVNLMCCGIESKKHKDVTTTQTTSSIDVNMLVSLLQQANTNNIVSFSERSKKTESTSAKVSDSTIKENNTKDILKVIERKEQVESFDDDIDDIDDDFMALMK